MPSEHRLDARGLPPPEPMERVLAVIHALGDGEYLRAFLPHEPLPLYPLLQQTGFDWQARGAGDIPCELFIWRRHDAQARSAVRHVLDGA